MDRVPGSNPLPVVQCPLRFLLAFRLYAAPCATVSKVLVNDIPECRADTGAALDCLSGLTVSSRNKIELAK